MGCPAKGHQDVADDDSSLWAGPSASTSRIMAAVFSLCLQRLAQMIRETHRLQSHAEIPARDTALFQQGFGGTIDSGGGGLQWRQIAQIAAKPFRGLCRRINYGAADSRGVASQYQDGCMGRARSQSRCGVPRHEAHHSESRDGTAGARSPHDQSNARRLDAEASPRSTKRLPASAHFKTARSVEGSRPARVAGTTRPSGNVT